MLQQVFNPQPNQHFTLPPSLQYIKEFPYHSEVKRKKASSFPNFDLTLPVPDTHLGTLRKYFKPSFSPNTNSWIVDLVFGKIDENGERNTYIFFVNENTRYLIVERVDGKSIDDLFPTVDIFVKTYGNKPLHVKGDGESAFPQTFAETNNPNVHTYFKDNTRGLHMTFSYKILDSVVRTIRNLMGDNFRFDNIDLMKEIAYVYNNTVHSAFDNKFTPAEVQNDVELENHYIRKWQQKSNEVSRLRKIKGLKDYKAGNVLLIYYPHDELGFKRRRNFDTLAKFIGYENDSNIIVRPYSQDRDIIIPEIWSKFVAKDEASVPERYYKFS
jgi:hypothetical protein